MVALSATACHMCLVCNGRQYIRILGMKQYLEMSRSSEIGCEEVISLRRTYWLGMFFRRDCSRAEIWFEWYGLKELFLDNRFVFKRNIRDVKLQ